MKLRVVDEYCKGCGYCITICPKNVLKEYNHLNSKGYVIPEILNMEDCIYCKKCELICPEMAITIEKEEVET